MRKNNNCYKDMNEVEDFQGIKGIYNLCKDSLKNNNHRELKNSLKLIKSAEDLFLKTYRKKKKEGVYYTSINVSDFMATEAVVLLLNKYHGENKIENINDIFKLNSDDRENVCKTLLNIKICDPACGSGVFLLSAANILFRIIRDLNPNLKTYKIRTQIINNLHGHDINEYAIKLSILKLFDWAYQEINDDLFKIMSLLESNLKIKNSLTLSKIPKFDIILSNPPYGNILTFHEKQIFKKEKIYNDIYCVFLMKALEWSNGIIALLVPKSFLLRQGYIEFRRKLLSNASILKIFDIGSKLFKKATNEVQIVIYENKTTNEEKNLNVYDYPNKQIIKYPKQDVDKLRICFNLNCPLCVKAKKLYVYTFENNCPYCGSETVKLNRIRIKTNNLLYQLINKIESKGDLNYLNHIKLPRMIRGEEDAGLKQVKAILNKDLKGSCYFINAKDDFRYYYIEKKRSFNIEEISDSVLKGNNYEYYKEPKLLIKHNNIIPEAIYTDENICFTSSVYSLLHEDVNELKFLCAILNSILIQFYCIYGINNQKDTTINLNQYMIRHIPIVAAKDGVKFDIVSKVDDIIDHMKNSMGQLNEDIGQPIKELDDMIFNLYSMTEKEQSIIKSHVKNQIEFFKNVYKK